MKLINIGCGTTYHKSWLNFDMSPPTSDVTFIDLRKGIPLDDGSADACYTSHVLEHLSVAEGRQLLFEIKRILKPGGVVRVVVPDLEQIVKAYLLSLKSAENGSVSSDNSYDWMILELLDQMVRTFEGGEMGRFMKLCPEDTRKFIRSRIGTVGDEFWNSVDSNESLFKRLLSKRVAWCLSRFQFFILRVLAVCMAGERGKAVVEEGWFRTSGEVHRWMYDRFSLRRLLVQSGFTDVEVCSCDTSRIALFSTYNLDSKDGVIRKPDSLYMEGIRP